MKKLINFANSQQVRWLVVIMAILVISGCSCQMINYCPQLFPKPV